MGYRSLVIGLVVLSASTHVEADGMLDPSFGNGGLVTTDFSGFSSDDGFSVVVLPDGRAVAVGYTNENLAFTYMAAARYLVSGALDPTFGGAGLINVGFPFPPGELGAMTAIARAVLLQADGRLVLVGEVSFNTPTTGKLRFALARLDLDGSFDPSFGTDGRVTTVFTSPAIATSGLLQLDGRIVAVGILGLSDLQGVLAAARYNPDGSPDATFGTAGTVTLPGFPVFKAPAAALQPDGKIVIGGSVGSDFAVVRLLPNGAPDPSFGGDGLVITDFGGTESGTSVIVLGDGRIVLGGYTKAAEDFALVRYLTDGTVDTTFGNGGLAIGDSGGQEIASQTIQLPNGKLLVAGRTDDPGADDFLLARFEAGGALDTSFGRAGFLRTDFPGWTAACRAVALAGPDLVLTAGGVGAGEGDFALARYIASTPVQLLAFAVE